MTVRLPGGARSRAVLVGTTLVADPDLSELPEVRGDLGDLAAALSDGGVRCSVLADRTARAVNEELEKAASQAEDLLLVHYAGHGLLDARGRLFLAVPETRLELVRWTALPFRDVRDVLMDAPARERVLVLDCRWEPEAVEALGDPRSVLAEQLGVVGVPTLVTAYGSPAVSLTRLLARALHAGSDTRTVYRALLRGSGTSKFRLIKN